MNDRPTMMPIKLMKAHCHAWPSGHCWSACNPYYSGHYRTRKEAQSAAVAARKTAAKRWGAKRA